MCRTLGLLVLLALAVGPGQAVDTYPADRTAEVTTYFRGAVGADDFLVAARDELSLRGFTPNNSIALVNLCRDEATNFLKDKVDEYFGSSFNINGLGGVLTCGTTGLRAGLSHSPVQDGREKYVFFSFPHVGVDTDSVLGHIHRHGRPAVSDACGALKAALGYFQANGTSKALELDFGDVEFSILLQRLEQQLKLEEVTDDDVDTYDLAAMTKVADRRFITDLEELIGLAVNTTKADYAVFTGVLVHNWPTSEADDVEPLEYLWITTAYTVINGGPRTELPDLLSTSGALAPLASGASAPGAAPVTASSPTTA